MEVSYSYHCNVCSIALWPLKVPFPTLAVYVCVCVCELWQFLHKGLFASLADRLWPIGDS